MPPADAGSNYLSFISVRETLTGAPGIVDLWYWFYEALDEPDLLAAYEALMAPDERARHRCLRSERDRHLFLATRALVRCALSRYAAVAPGEWRFAAGTHGRPRVAWPSIAPALHFNLANTPGLVVCAVSLAHERVGVDAERTDRNVDIAALAERYLAPYEARNLRVVPAPEQKRRFFVYWTLKESYLKARGLGLALPLDLFWFVVDDGAIEVVFEKRLDDDARRWRFALLDLVPGHLTAVGVDTGGAPLSLRALHMVPLRGPAGSATGNVSCERFLLTSQTTMD